MSETFSGLLQKSREVHRQLGGNVHTPAQLPLPENPPSYQAMAVPIGRRVRLAALVGRGEVDGFVTWPRANWVLHLPLLRAAASNLQLPTAGVLCLHEALSDCVRAPPARQLQAAAADGRIQTPFVLRRGRVLERRRGGGGGVGGRFGPGR